MSNSLNLDIAIGLLDCEAGKVAPWIEDGECPPWSMQQIFACISLGRNLAIAAALARAFDLGDVAGRCSVWSGEFSDFVDDSWKPGSGREAP